MTTKVAPLPNVTTNTQTIHQTLKFFFIMLQIVGFLPVKNLTGNADTLKFKWLSFPTIYSLYLMLFSYIICGFYVHDCLIDLDPNVVAQELTSTVTATFSIFLFFQMAIQWPELMQAWSKIDLKFNAIYGFPKFLKLKMVIVYLIYLIFVTGDYVLFLFGPFLQERNIPDFEHIIKGKYSFIFDYIPYNYFTVLAFIVPSWAVYFALTLTDIFVILISMSIYCRFEQINKTIKLIKNKNAPVSYWANIHRNYSEMGGLVRKINERISGILILSYGSNMLLLITRLFNTFSSTHSQNSSLLRIYFFSFLILRLLSVYYCSSRVNGESRKPIRLLFSISSDVYEAEVRRWFFEIKLNEIALRGGSLFKIAPGLVLRIAGAVVTYELIFIQFTQPK